MYAWIFGPPADPPDVQIQKWKERLAVEIRLLTSRIAELDQLENDTIQIIRGYAKENQVGSVKILTKELIHLQKMKSRMYEARATINSVSTQLSEQLANIRMTKAMSASVEMMKHMNALVTVPMIGRTMYELSREMHKAGIIRELASEATAPDDFEIGEAADSEVDAFLASVAKNWKLPDVVTAKQPSVQQPGIRHRSNKPVAEKP